MLLHCSGALKWHCQNTHITWSWLTWCNKCKKKYVKNTQAFEKKMPDNGWHNWYLGTNTGMLPGESGLTSVLNLVGISVYLQRGSSLSSLQDQELLWPQSNCLFIGCFLCELCFLFPSLWPEWCSAISHTQVQRPAARLCARRGRTAQQWADLCRKAPKSPWVVSAPWRDCALALHKAPHSAPHAQLQAGVAAGSSRAALT